MRGREAGKASRGRQSGQAIVVMAAIIMALVALGALVFDASAAMADRRALQAASDAASLAGSRSLSASSNQSDLANWTAMEYLATPLSFSLPLASGCTSSSNCAAGAYSEGTYTITLADSTLSGSSYPNALDVTVQHTSPSIFARLFGVSSTTQAAAARGVLPGAGVTSVLYGVEALGGDAQINGGGAGTQTDAGPVYASGDFGGNNNPHATGVATVLKDVNGNACPGNSQNHVDVGGVGNGGDWVGVGSGSVSANYVVAAPASFAGVAPTTTGPTYTSAVQALDGNGNWKPGIYNGFNPVAGKMAGGVYKIINTNLVSFGVMTNSVPAAPGTADTAGAVAIVLDSSDTGSLDLGLATLNGLDDLQGSGGTGTRDPMGTHNFLVYGGSGAGAFTGGMTMGPGSSANLSGVIYLPGSSFTSDGNATYTFVGSVIFSTVTVNGGGHGTQLFDWVCNLSVVAGLSTNGGLTR